MNNSCQYRKAFSKSGFILMFFLYFIATPSYAQNSNKIESISWVDQFENQEFDIQDNINNAQTWIGIDEFRLPKISPEINHTTDSSVHNSDLAGLDNTLLDYLLLDLSDRRVYVYKQGQEKSNYPVAIGREGWETPKGEFIILNMERNPSWQNPWTGEVIAPGRNNPLGEAWIGFWQNGNNQIGFHGTPTPHLIGQAVSHGCVRMYNRDILSLFQHVHLGMTVWVKE